MTLRLGAVAGSLILVATTIACSDAPSTAPTTTVRPTTVNAAAQSGIQLKIGSFGDGTKAQWKNGEGLVDAKGSRSQALILQKITLTSTFSASYGIVKGLEGLPPSALALLAWEHRNNSHCGAGAPRWNVTITGATGNSYTVFLGCAAAAKFAGSQPGWTRDVWDQSAIAAEITAAAGSDAVGGRIASVVILFDEGIDVGAGFVVLDNITVNGKVFTSSSD